MSTVRPQAFRGDHPDEGQECQHQRQLERDAEGQQEVSDEAEVVVGGDDLDEMAVVEAEQPVERIAQGDEADEEPGEEESDAHERRRHRVLPLVRRQSGRREAPELMDPHGSRQRDAGGYGELQEHGKTFADGGHRDPPCAVVTDQSIGFDGERTQQEPEDRVPEQEPDDRPHRDRGDAHDRTPAQLFEVPDQGHPGPGHCERHEPLAAVFHRNHLWVS
jgi:hypothetical protein